MSTNFAAIQIEGVSRYFGKHRALDMATLEVPQGEVFGLLGPNGAGKTTLFSIIAGFLKAHGGSVHVLGEDTTCEGALQGRMTILPQDALFQRNVPILDQLVFFRELEGLPRKQARAEVEATLASVGLQEYIHRGVQVLSHGMNKRLGVAQAFLGSPEVILLDEPTEGLDPRNARNIRDLIQQLKGQATVVVSSHNLAEVQELCDGVAILQRGRVVAAGDVASVTGGGQHFELTFEQPLEERHQDALASIPGVKHIEDRGENRYRIEIQVTGSQESDEAVRRQILEHCLRTSFVPTSFTTGSSLESAFLELTNEPSVL